MGEKEENSHPHPTILETEEKEIPEKKPPNNKIRYCVVVEQDESAIK